MHDPYKNIDARLFLPVLFWLDTPHSDEIIDLDFFTLTGPNISMY